MRFCSLKCLLLVLFCGLVTVIFPFAAADDGAIKLLTTVRPHHKRTSYLFTPFSYDDKRSLPLVMVFHGYLGSADLMMRMTEFNTLAEKEGFLVVYPEALHEKWNANLGKSESSEVDVEYVQSLIAQIQTERNVDTKRIYATGFSSGGFFSQRLACEMPDTIAAVAAVASTIGEPLMRSCKPSRPIPFLAINGTSDPIITWDGHVRRVRYAFKDADITTVPTMVRFWKNANECQDVSIKDVKSSTKPPGPKVTINHYHGCKEDADVDQVIIYQGGHTWPDSTVSYRLAKRLLGYTSKDINASKTIWEFFEKHPKKD